MALRRERVRVRRRDADAAAARRPRQGAQAHDRAGAGADPDLAGRDRAEEHRAGGRDRRRLDPDAVLARARGRVPAAAGGGLRARPATARASTTSRSPRWSTSWSPTTLDAARDAMRHYVALYVGGMGSRDKNFYNALVQPLRVRGRRARGPGPVPGGQEGRGRGGAAGRADRHRVAVRAARRGARAARRVPRRRRRHADGRADGVDARRSRCEQLRLVAELRCLRVLLGAFGDPGHAFPMLALGEALVGARPRGRAADVAALGGAGRVAAGMTFAAAPEYQVFPTRERPLKPYEAAVRAARETRPVVRDVRARRRGVGHPHARAGAGRRARGRAGGDARPARAPAPAARASRRTRSARGCRGPRSGRALWRRHRPAGGARARAGAARVQRLPRAARARPAAVGPHGPLAVADAGGDAAAARVPARLAARGCAWSGR